MRQIKTKQELDKWIIDATNAGYRVPCAQNGGGFNWINSWDSWLTDEEDYEEEVEVLSPGEELADFRAYMSDEEMEGMKFVRVRHNNGYNEENFDLQFGIYEILEID